VTADPVATGTIGEYHWIEWVPTRDVILTDLVQGMAPQLSGLRGVNVSWDSGLLLASDVETKSGWRMEQGRAISPPIDEAVAAAWPYSDCGWDEWYFFSQLPDDLQLSAYCNWGGLSLADWQDIVEVPTAVNLHRQLARAHPILVLGEGTKLFAITTRLDLIEQFRRIVGTA
jgi:hypothetical protein